MQNLISTHAHPGPVQQRVAIFGGVYNNHLSLKATIEDAKAQGATSFYCLGDMGGFGPSPDKAFPALLETPNMYVMQGNYDHSIGNRLEDCACGYTDPRDNHFAQISFDYTAANTHNDHKDWLRDLPTEFRRTWGKQRVLCAHGSPRKVNEFLWQSMCPDAFLEYLLQQEEVDVLFITHTGIPWMRRLPSNKLVVNVGAIGRPGNRATTAVDYVLVDIFEEGLTCHLRPVHYDHESLAHEMRAEGLPCEFVETILTGYWTTCLEILPAKERALGIY